MKSRAAGFSCALLLAALAACQTSKSSSPTAPTVAGPIPGVNITAPALLEPAQGVKFKDNEQPIRLVIQNAATNGQRALSYTFEVAADPDFGSKVFSRSSVPPGADNKTSVQIDRLDIGRAYYWRAWAQDGANTGAIATANFEIFPKPAVNPPVAVSPINNAQVTSTTPEFVVHNAQFVGPVGGLVYEFHVASDQAFSHLVTQGTFNEGNGDTRFRSNPLPSSATLFWRSRATDGETTSAWSATQAFKTPAAPAPSPSPSPSPAPGGGGGSCASSSGPAIINCISAKYPERLVAGISVSQRQTNMSFLRDRIIEAGKCGGLDLGWNLKRGGPELSIDFITQRVNGAVDGIDIGFAYDDTSTPLRLAWATGGAFPFYASYANAFSCK
jgi:hypothetical protein